MYNANYEANLRTEVQCVYFDMYSQLDYVDSCQSLTHFQLHRNSVGNEELATSKIGWNRLYNSQLA